MVIGCIARRMPLRCVIWEDPDRTMRNVLSALLMCHGSQLDQSLTTIWLRPNRLLTAVLLHWMICRLQIAYSLFHQTSCWHWNHMLFSRLLVPFTVKTSTPRKDGSAFNILQMNFGWSGRLSSCSCRRVDRNGSNLKNGDVVILKDKSTPRNNWQLAGISQTYPSDDDIFRKVKVAVLNVSLGHTGKRTKSTVYHDRPVQKLVLLVPCDDAQ